MARGTVAVILAFARFGVLVSASDQFLAAKQPRRNAPATSGRNASANLDCPVCDLNDNMKKDGVIVRQVYDGESASLVSSSFWRTCSDDPPGLCTPTPMYQAGASRWGEDLCKDPNYFDTPVLGVVIDNPDVIRNKLDFFCETSGQGTCTYYASDCNLDYRRSQAGAAEDNDGRGCHTECQTSEGTCNDDYLNWQGGDKTWAVNDQGGCQCNTYFHADSWVESWAASPVHGDILTLDRAMCWYGAEDVIEGASHGMDSAFLLQLALWQNQGWRTNDCPRQGNSPYTDRYYAGWNEVPLKRDVVNNPDNWRALVINLPVGMLPDDIQNEIDGIAMDRLTADLNKYAELLSSDPYSARDLWNGQFPIVFAKAVGPDDSNNYNREFFCENWSTSDGCWSVIDENADYGSGRCYLQWNC